MHWACNRWSDHGIQLQLVKTLQPFIFEPARWHLCSRSFWSRPWHLSLLPLPNSAMQYADSSDRESKIRPVDAAGISHDVHYFQHLSTTENCSLQLLQKEFEVPRSQITKHQEKRPCNWATLKDCSAHIDASVKVSPSFLGSSERLAVKCLSCRLFSSTPTAPSAAVARTLCCLRHSLTINWFSFVIDACKLYMYERLWMIVRPCLIP